MRFISDTEYLRNTQAFLPRKSNIFDVHFFVHSVCSILLYLFSFIHKNELVNKFEAARCLKHLRGQLEPVYMNSHTARE